MSLIKPLRIRPGARFTCFGDGLCCTDVHAFGPLDEVEAATLRLINEGAVTEHGDNKDLVIIGSEEGDCIFQHEGGCSLHAALGAKGKPKTCRQFPFLLIATPAGGRIATEHRCPCRTMGEGEPITVEAAFAACDAQEIDRMICDTIPLDDDVEIEMQEWERIEAPLLEGELTFSEQPFSGGDWRPIGQLLAEEEDTSRFAQALRCFGAAVLDEPIPEIGWRTAFDRAEARSEEGDPEAMLVDWVRDVIWSLDWAFSAPWRQTRIDLATRMHIARRIAASYQAVGRRADTAMAEAIAVVELVARSDDYAEFIASLEAA